jgi:DNA-binding MarR family transcriptional regulator
MKRDAATHRIPSLPCACANLRRAARAVTRMYNQELRPEAIEITQYTLLMALERTGETSQGKLGALLALDSTTLTRMLKPLIKRGWVHAEEGKDRRLRIFRLARAGQEKLQQSRRGWNRAQQRLRAAVGENIMAQLLPLLTEVTQALGQE